MKKILQSFSLIMLNLLLINNVMAQSGIEYGDNYIVFEAEATDSPLTEWVIQKEGDVAYQKYLTNPTPGIDAINGTYLEYKGAFNAAKAPLEYKFTCPKTANYTLAMRMHSPLRTDEKADKRNDIIIRLEGNYESAAQKWSKHDLETDHKFFGRGPNKWGNCYNLEHNGFAPAVYALIEGEEYTFVMTGRSGTTSIDYILFFEAVGDADIELSNKDLVLQLPDRYRPGLGLVNPTSINIDPNPTSVRKGTALQLNLVLEPSSAKPEVSWSSSDEDIISVDENGMITAHGEVGENVTITVTSEHNNQETTSIATIVEWYTINLESLSVSPETSTVIAGNTLSLKVTHLPTGADDTSVNWASSDDEVATVSSDGVVTTIKDGTVTISATSKVNNTISDEATITVVPLVLPSISFDNDDNYLNGSFYSGETMDVSINFEAGSLQTIAEPIMLKLRLMQDNNGWKTISDVSLDFEEFVGESAGTFTASLSLDKLTASEDLPADHFYYLFIKSTNSAGISSNKGLQPIQIQKAKESAVGKNEALKFNMSPNPAKDWILITGDTNITQNPIVIYNMNGSIVYSNRLNSNSSKIDVSTLQKGIYIVHLGNVGNSYVRKLIIK